MMTSRWIALCLLLCSAAWPSSTRGDSIDTFLGALYESKGITPASACSDPIFLRRITLDLAGRIPTLDEVSRFREHPDRGQKIDELLASPEFARSWSELWTAMWVGYPSDDGLDRDVLQQWIEDCIQRNVPYDQMVRRVISATGDSALDGPTVFLVRHRDEPTIKVSRTFLGVRLDCARCHDHPFDRWTQANYEQFERFFQGMRTTQTPQGFTLQDDIEQTRRVDVEQRPVFLTNARPRTAAWRSELALFVTHSKPFARNYANRVWYQLLGRGIFDPPDDFSIANPPASQELLDYLAEQASQQRFDIRAMVRLICNSDAYQRDSRPVPQQAVSQQAVSQQAVPQQAESTKVFAVRSMKPMTSEQAIDSIGTALGKRVSIQDRSAFIRNTIGSDSKEDFSSIWEYRETVQGLMHRLTFHVETPTASLEELYLRVLTRAPTQEERLRCESMNLNDVAFALLNSNEFFFHH